MYESPSPTHGFIPVVVAFWLYIGLAGAIALVGWKLGMPNNLSIYLFVLAAIILLKPFMPVFRRYLPNARHEE